MEEKIYAAEFLRDIEEIVFNGFKNTLGNEINGKYELSDRKTLSEYIKKYFDGREPKLTDNLISSFHKKYCYFIYPENRYEQYMVKGKVKDLSIEEFSSRCVLMFFQRFGINFSFLRVNKEDKSQFSNKQKDYLDDLFSQVINLFKQNKEGVCSKENVILLLKLLFVKYRYNLFQIDKERLHSFNSYLEDEVNNFITLPAMYSFHLGKPACYSIMPNGKLILEEQDEEVLSSFRDKKFQELNILMSKIYEILSNKNNRKVVHHVNTPNYALLKQIQNGKIDIIHSYSMSEFKIDEIEELLNNTKTRVFINLSISDYLTLFHQYVDSEHKKFSVLRCDWYCEVLLGAIDHSIMNSKVFAEFCLNIFMINMYATIREIQLKKFLKLED